MIALGGGCRIPMAALCEPYAEGFYRLHLYLGDPIGGKGFYACLDDLTAAGIQGGGWRAWLEDQGRICRGQGISLPCDVDEHALLRFWGNPEAMS